MEWSRKDNCEWTGQCNAHEHPKHALAEGSHVYMEGMVPVIRYQDYVVTSTEYIKHDKRMIHNEIWNMQQYIAYTNYVLKSVLLMKFVCRKGS